MKLFSKEDEQRMNFFARKKQNILDDKPLTEQEWRIQKEQERILQRIIKEL